MVYTPGSTSIFADMTSYAFWRHLSSPPSFSSYLGGWRPCSYERITPIAPVAKHFVMTGEPVSSFHRPLVYQGNWNEVAVCTRTRSRSLTDQMADTEGGSSSSSLPIFSVEDVQQHNKEGDAWITHRGKVYDVSDFLERHPGGKDILLSYAGQDVTTLMTQEDIHEHTSFAYGWLGKYQIGRLKCNVSVFLPCAKKSVFYICLLIFWLAVFS